MRFTSNLLGQISRAIGLSRTGGFETTLTIPPTLLPIMIGREPMLAGNTTFTPGILQRSSCSAIGQVTQANSGGLTSDLLLLSAGVWEIAWSTHYTSNFISVASNFNAALVLNQGSGAQFYWLSGYLAAGASAQQNSFQTGIVTVSLAAQCQLQVNVGASGVGQTHSMLATVLCNKLL